MINLSQSIVLHRIKKQKIHSFAREGANLNLTDKNKIMEVKMEHDLFGSILFLALQWKITLYIFMFN